MATLRFPIETGSTHFLTIKGGLFGFNKATISYDDQPLLANVTSKELSNGVALALPDGSNVSIKRIRGGWTKPNGFDVLRNGVPLPGSLGTPGHALFTAKEAGKLLYGIAALNVVYALVVQFFHNDALSVGNDDAASWPYLVAALLITMLGWLVYKKQSLIALAIAIACLIGDAVLTFTMQIASGARPNAGAIMMRAVFVVVLINAFRTIVQHKSELKAMRA
jgi:hypothetical protein